MGTGALPKILAVDFDGTLVEDDYPNIGRMNIRLLHTLKAMQCQGVKLILWTCRNGDSLTDAVEHCRNHDLIFDAVNKNLKEVRALYGGDTRKVFADKYLDDKNLGSIEELFLWGTGDEGENKVWL